LVNRPDQPTKDGESSDDTSPVETFRCDRIPPRQQNREHDQDRDGADVNKHLHESDKLSPEQEIEGSDADKCHGQTECGMNELGKGGLQSRRRESEWR